jgi:hypothetical protein
MDKNRLNGAFEALTPDKDASERMLGNIYRRSERGMNPFARFAAITAALCMFAGMGGLMWRYMERDVLPGGTKEAVYSEDFAYGAAHETAEYMIFRWGISYSSYTPQSPMIIESEQDMELFGFWSGINMSLVSSVPPQKLPSVDYEKKAVIAVWGVDAPGGDCRYGAPIVEIGQDIVITRRLVPAQISDEERTAMHGYLIILDRGLLEGRGIIYDESQNPEQEEVFAHESLPGADIRLIFSSQRLGYLLEQPGKALRFLGRSWSWQGPHVSDTFPYIIYSSFKGFGPNGLYSSNVTVMYLDGSGREWTSGNYYSKDIRLEPLGGDSWALYHSEPMFSSYRPLYDTILAELTVFPDGVRLDILHEDGMGLAANIQIYDFFGTLPEGVQIYTPQALPVIVLNDRDALDEFFGYPNISFHFCKDYSAPLYWSLYDVDFSTKAVAAVYGYDMADLNYQEPEVTFDFDRGRINVHRRINNEPYVWQDPIYDAAGEYVIRGYLLVVDRELLEDFEIHGVGWLTFE